MSGETNRVKKKQYQKIYLKSLGIICRLHIKPGNNFKEEIAHYTQKNTARILLFNEESMFRLSSITTANDPREGLTLLDYLWREKSFSVDLYSNEIYRAFAGCFTFNHECLNQFRLYGKEENQEATGVSIVFEPGFFNQDIESSTKLTQKNLEAKIIQTPQGGKISKR